LGDKLEAYTDGTSLGNPGPGAFSIILIYERAPIVLSRAFRKTTNNRMELMAVVETLNFCKNNNIKYVKIYTDSQLVAKAINEGWLERWNRNGWKTSAKQNVMNIDLWKQFLHYRNFVQPEILWVPGHSGNTFNEKADKIAKQKAKEDAIEIDYGFEQEHLSFFD
jgi:ribonuclease HI